MRLIYIIIYIKIRAKVKKDFIILKAKLTTGLTQEHDHQIQKSNMGTVITIKNTIIEFKNQTWEVL